MQLRLPAQLGSCRSIGYAWAFGRRHAEATPTCWRGCARSAVGMSRAWAEGAGEHSMPAGRVTGMLGLGQSREDDGLALGPQWNHRANPPNGGDGVSFLASYILYRRFFPLSTQTPFRPLHLVVNGLAHLLHQRVVGFVGSVGTPPERPPLLSTLSAICLA